MATPLNTFLESAQKLAIKPLKFWPVSESKTLLAAIMVATKKLQAILTKKGLTDSRASSALQALEKTLNSAEFDEFHYIQVLSALTDIYVHAPTQDAKAKELLRKLEQEVGRAKKRILEYHLLLEALAKKAVKLSEEQQTKADLKLLQEVGVFYVLEYTLQVLSLWPRLNEKGMNAILHDGLSIKEGNLPAYLPLEDTFRKDLCLKVFDPVLRIALLCAFYDLEEVFASEDLKKIGTALKRFNLALLQAFEKKGLAQFKALIYKPFGNNVPVSTILSAVQALPVS